MTKRYWLLTGAWVFLVAFSASALFEFLDRRDIGLVVSGLSVTASQIVVAGSSALLPPAIVALWIASRLRDEG